MDTKTFRAVRVLAKTNAGLSQAIEQFPKKVVDAAIEANNCAKCGSRTTSLIKALGGLRVLGKDYKYNKQNRTVIIFGRPYKMFALIRHL